MFRKPKKRELKVIKNALRFFGSEDFLGDYIILIKEGEKKEVYMLSKDLWEFLKNNRIEFTSAGIKIGEVGKRLRLTVEGAFWLVKRRKRVWVNEKGEMLFLYGRDLFASSIVKVEDFKENEVVFVCNRDNDIIGIGKARFDSDKIRYVEKDRVVIDNLVDRGEYIRRTKLYKAF